jgi:phosphatidylserine/phosphatidylglycerophosphate/cardiolipin synthase-like enzyme
MLAMLLILGFLPGNPWRHSGTGTPPFVYLPLVDRGFLGGPTSPQISALYYDTYLSGEPDEAFQVYNPLDVPVALEGWRLTNGTRSLSFPSGLQIPARAKLWCARQATAFANTFGTVPGCEYAADSDPQVPDLTGAAWQLTNTGGRLTLVSPAGTYSDTLVYEAGNPELYGWSGPAVWPYQPSSSFSQEGQILYRKLDQTSGLPVPDTDTRADWASDPDDVVNGRKVQYAGWDLDRFFLPRTYIETAHLQILVSPDHAFNILKPLLEGTEHSIRLEGYTFESASLAEVVAARARAGVEVEMLLEGGPPGGVTDQQRWVVQQIAAAGGQVYYMRSDPANGVGDRYTYQHGKFWVLDGKIALIGSENPSASSFPDDDKADGTFGQRGVTLVTDAPSVVAELTAVMDADIAPGVHGDIWPWDPADPILGAPPAGFTPSYASGGTFYPIQKAEPFSDEAVLISQVFHSPEQSLRSQDSLLGLIEGAGPGDVVLVEQLYEHTYWGAEASNVQADPNPRLEAYIAAARRGATVRVLLDSHQDNTNLDSPRCNLRTVEYLRALANVEGLDLDARRADPTGEGIHNKMILARIGGQGWVVAGSLNGSEVSTKVNREMSLRVASNGGFEYLADVFWYDWAVTKDAVTSYSERPR